MNIQTNSLSENMVCIGFPTIDLTRCTEYIKEHRGLGNRRNNGDSRERLNRSRIGAQGLIYLASNAVSYRNSASVGSHVNYSTHY